MKIIGGQWTIIIEKIHQISLNRKYYMRIIFLGQSLIVFNKGNF